MFKDSHTLWHTQPQALWQVSIATIVITGYGIVWKRLRFWVEISTIVREIEWLRVNKTEVNQKKLLSRNIVLSIPTCKQMKKEIGNI